MGRVGAVAMFGLSLDLEGCLIMRVLRCLPRWLAIVFLLAAVSCQGRLGATEPDESLADAPASGGEVDHDVDGAARLARANSLFAFDHYKVLAKGEREAVDDLFFSPYSIHTALAMTLEGARGRTARQMEEVLHVGTGNADLGGRPRLHQAAEELIQHFNDEARSYELHVANALWGEQEMMFRDEFLTTLEQHYGAGLHAMDFIGEPESSRREINSWVEDQTEGRIEELLPDGTIDPDTRLMLTNAVYFKAAWATPFQEGSTADRAFHLADGSTIEVPTMREDRLQVGLHEEAGVQALELPYEEQDLAMLILLPKEPDGLWDLAERLDVDRLERIVDSLESIQARVDLPRFEFESEFDLREALGVLGMPLAFSREADFTGMAEDAEAEQLHLSDAIHKAFIDVHEEGTEAAAATAIGARVVAAPVELPHVRVDRPFLFLIRDTDTQTILFFGHVMDPRDGGPDVTRGGRDG